MLQTVETDISIFNMPRWVLVAGSSRRHESIIRKIGAHGLQFAAVDNIFYDDIAENLIEAGRVHSFHQSFAETGLARLFMSRPVESLLDLAPLEQKASIKFGMWLPLIVHPNEQYLGDKPKRAPLNFKNIRNSGIHGPLLHQPTVEVLSRWSVLSLKDPVRTAQDMLEVQGRLGFDEKAVALDLHHIQAQRGGFEALGLDWCIGFAGQLAAQGSLEYPGEVQMAFRPDFGGDMNHLILALSGNLPATPHGQIFKEIIGSLPPWQSTLRITTEVLSRMIAKTHAGMNYIEGNHQLMTAINQMALGNDVG